MPNGHAAVEFPRFLPVTGRVSATDPAGPIWKPAKSPITGGLEGSVYTLKNELSISSGGGLTGPNPGPMGSEAPLEHRTVRSQRPPHPLG
jgi:hypothetical protein